MDAATGVRRRRSELSRLAGQQRTAEISPATTSAYLVASPARSPSPSASAEICIEMPQGFERYQSGRLAVREDLTEGESRWES
jgi:hypothetical protein